MSKHERKIVKGVNRFADKLSNHYTFLFFVIATVAWIIYGIFQKFDEKWFREIDFFVFASMFVSFFAVEHSQRVDNEAIQQKLDEIIKALPNTNKDMVGKEAELKGETKSQN
jgi:low affinity Fe/Cu permease